MSDLRKISRALISVSDKTGIVDFARALTDQGVELLSTGGTYRLLSENAIAVTEVSDYTGFPEMMDGRVKTLHPKVHGGILGRRGQDDAVMSEHGIKPIDMVVVTCTPLPLQWQIQTATCRQLLRILILAAPPWFAPRQKTIKTWPLWSMPTTTKP